MVSCIRIALVGLALLLGAPTAFAQVVSTIKSPPLQDSDSFIIPINIHIPAANPPFAGWAGALVSAHILDASEVDILSVHALPSFAVNLLGPTANASSTGAEIVFPHWHRLRRRGIDSPAFAGTWREPRSGMQIAPVRRGEGILAASV